MDYFSEVHKIIAMHTKVNLYIYRLHNMYVGYVLYRGLVLLKFDQPPYLLLEIGG